jgi:signal transduction histidine kinase
MTAKASRRDIRMGMEMGADDYLTKPFSYDELLQALGTQLAKAEAISKAQTAHVDKLRHLIARSLPHEFRTPLTTILGFSDLMVRDAQEDGNDELLVRASQIFSAGKRLHRLVENYLLYTELSMIPPNGDQTAYTFNIHNYERTDDICKEAEAVAETFKRSDDLTCRVHDKAIPIDNAVMVKIVHELMRNAFAHSEPDDAVSLTTRQENDEFILQVQDRGHGMMPEQIKEIGAYVQFNRQFYEQQGVGLGLAIVRQLVRLSQGRLHIDSEEGVGTTVTIAYPLTESEA